MLAKISRMFLKPKPISLWLSPQAKNMPLDPLHEASLQLSMRKSAILLVGQMKQYLSFIQMVDTIHSFHWGKIERTIWEIELKQITQNNPTQGLHELTGVTWDFLFWSSFLFNKNLLDFAIYEL